MKFRYDPMGNRIEKRLYHLDGSGSVIRQSATHYVRDAQGNPLAVYNLLGGDTLVVNEFNLYGSNRLGMLTTSDTLVCATCTTATAPAVYLSPVGNKRYELSNHLGNVMTVISDKPVPIDTTSDGLWDYFNAFVVSATDYYPFGMGMPGRSSLPEPNYRFGHSGKEGLGSGSTQLMYFGHRIFDNRISRWVSPDPFASLYPTLSSYCGMGNTPTKLVDKDGGRLWLSGENAESDIRLLVQTKYQDRISFTADGELLVNLTASAVTPVLKQNEDEGLLLLYNLASAEENYMYMSANRHIQLVNAAGNLSTPKYDLLGISENGIYSWSKTKMQPNTLGEWKTWFQNTPSSKQHRPKVDESSRKYDGIVVISAIASFVDDYGAKPRGSIVFHELFENYQRTTNRQPWGVPKFDSKGNAIELGIHDYVYDYSYKNGAHQLASEAEERYYSRSAQPGVADIE
ncbi:RHS repeat domain-containing protein [Candidatus Pollutiaquabacter sp.]|uniref:RHS repeat domain-containing protein n=1 Tax=Candidatus Pollutiaquabacter sp. TaxID=3416354 RepID=UPI003C957C42|nr:hypothetical protein [Bacteroidota bacterium]